MHALTVVLAEGPTLSPLPFSICCCGAAGAGAEGGAVVPCGAPPAHSPQGEAICCVCVLLFASVELVQLPASCPPTCTFPVGVGAVRVCVMMSGVSGAPDQPR
jgi:hypothetical protein